MTTIEKDWVTEAGLRAVVLMSRCLMRRTPKRNGGFSWGRSSTADGDFTTWRLFRRDCRGALHTESLTFASTEARSDIAQRLRRARHQLRDRVDEIDLAVMGIAA